MNDLDGMMVDTLCPLGKRGSPVCGAHSPNELDVSHKLHFDYALRRDQVASTSILRKHRLIHTRKMRSHEASM